MFIVGLIQENRQLLGIMASRNPMILPLNAVDLPVCWPIWAIGSKTNVSRA